jgi:predicted porin
MKKTIIAAAVAASFVAPVAMAEVSISGMVNPEFIDSDSTTAGSNGWNRSSINTDLVFKASEDLGNGMKATAKIHYFTDTTDQKVDQDEESSNVNNTGTADLSVTVSGDFGSVVVGRFEPASEGVMDAFMNIDASHDLDLEDNTNAIGRSNNGLAYMSPSMNGFSVGVGTFAGASATAATDSFDGATEVFVKYSNGPLTVMANNTEVDAGKEHQSVAVSYKIGDLELRAMERSTNAGGATTTDKDSTFIGAKYTMGANTFAIGMLDDDGVNCAAGSAGNCGTPSTADANADAEIYSVSHAMSKNTSVYVTHLSSDAANADMTAFGIVQKF